MQNKKVTHYIVQRVTSTAMRNLKSSTDEAIIDLLDHGWQPWGSPTTSDDDVAEVLQAFVRYEDED